MDFWLGTAYLALAQAHFADENFEKAKDLGSRALELKPSSLRGAIVAASCAHLGQTDEAAPCPYEVGDGDENAGKHYDDDKRPY